MAQVPEDVLEYYDEVPRDCFIAGVPFAIRYQPDNVIIPYGMTLPNPNGGQGKWVKFSRFETFSQSCMTYWFDASGPSLDSLNLFVMPYTPLEDAYALHLRIINPRQLPQNPNHTFCSSSTHDEDSFSHQQLMELGEPDGGIGPHLKEGLLHIIDGVNLTFQVINYSMLWSKAEKFCRLQYIADPLSELLRRMMMCDKVLHEMQSSKTIEELDTDAVDARRHLAIEMIEEYGRGTLGVNPHDAIQSMYTELHDYVYPEDCHHCDPHLHPIDQEDHPATLQRLEGALADLGYQDYHLDLSIEEAEFRLMRAEGTVEYQHIILNALEDFSKARLQLEGAINPILNYIQSETSRHTLMGAVADVLGGSEGEDN